MTFVRTYDAATTAKSPLRHVLSLGSFPRLVWDNRYMLQNFLRRDLMGRVNGSFLGIYWLLLQPLFLFVVYFAVFGLLMGNWRWGATPDPHLALYLFSGVIAFHAVVEATSQSCAIIVDNGNLVKKVAFPSEVLLVHTSIVAVVIYLVGAVVCFVAGWALGVLEPGRLLLGLPLVLVVQFVMTLGIGLLLANLYVFVRDTVHIWRIVSMAWMFLSPVFWGRELLEQKLPPAVVDWVVILNPAFSLIQLHRLCLGAVGPQFGEFWPQLGTTTVWALVFLFLGYGSFMSKKHKFSDLI